MLVNETKIEWLPNNWIVVNDVYKFRYSVVGLHPSIVNKLVVRFPSFSEYGATEEEDVLHDICESFAKEMTKADKTYTFNYAFSSEHDEWVIVFEDIT